MKIYKVKGMTCDHCVHAVQKELSKVEGITGVDVDLDQGIVTVHGEGFSDEQVAAGIDEAGFDVVQN